MVKKTVAKSPAIYVGLDTNVLFTQSEDRLLSSEISDFIRNISPKLGLEVSWLLPGIVKQERRAQMNDRALQLLPGIRKVEKLIGVNLNITEEVLAVRVDEAIARNMVEHGLAELQFDPSVVEWDDVLRRSVERSAPFSPGATEKGFKDLIVLETFAAKVAQLPKSSTSAQIYLVTGDGRLQEAARDRFKDRNNVHVVENLNDLKTRMTSISSHISEDDIRKIQNDAHRKFFVKDETDTLYYKWDIGTKIQRIYQASAKPPQGFSTIESMGYHLDSTTFALKSGQSINFVSSLHHDLRAKGFRAKNVLALSSVAHALASEPSLLNAVPGAIAASALGASSNSYPPQNALAGQQGYLYPPPAPAPFEEMSMDGAINYIVYWSATLSQSGNLTRPKFESVNLAGISWKEP